MNACLGRASTDQLEDHIEGEPLAGDVMDFGCVVLLKAQAGV